MKGTKRETEEERRREVEESDKNDIWRDDINPSLGI